MDEDQINTLHRVALQAATDAGQILTDHWNKLVQISEKEFPWDLVTEVDKKSEAAILNLLHGSFPTHGTLSEEAGQGGSDKAEYQWIIDPLDGTTNYTHHYPMVCVSIALVHKSTPILGVVYNPIHNEKFHAGKGMGAKLNGKKISVSKTRTMQRSLLATGFAYDRIDNPDNNLEEFCVITNKTQGVRRGGSAALDLAYVACGRLDGFWEKGLKPWDTAAGIVIVEEAGGQVTDYDLSPINLQTGRLLVTNKHLHHELSTELIKIRHGRDLKA